MPSPTRTPTPSCSLPGDLNGNGQVDVADLHIEAAHWPRRPVGGADRPYDLNGDGAVDVLDLQWLAARLGQACP